MTMTAIGKKWILRAFAFTLLLGLSFILWAVYTAYTLADHAERALHAVNLTTVAVERYVDRERKWPKSWEDLATINTVDGSGIGIYSWPADHDWIKQYVTVDFHADPNILAKQTVEEFDAVKPIGVYYPYKQDGHIATLIETLRRTTPDRQAHARRGSFDGGLLPGRSQISIATGRRVFLVENLSGSPETKASAGAVVE